MRTAAAEKLLRVHLSEGDKWKGKPLYEAIVEKCREMGIAGATVIRGSEGYGAGTLLERGAHLFALSPNSPLTVQIVDSEVNIQRLLPLLDEMVSEGLIVMSDVDVLRYSRPSGT